MSSGAQTGAYRESLHGRGFVGCEQRASAAMLMTLALCLARNLVIANSLTIRQHLPPDLRSD